MPVVLACPLNNAVKIITYWGVNGTALARAMARGDTVAYVYDVTGYAAGDVVLINAPSRQMERLTIDTDGVSAAARTLTFTTGCLHAHSIDQEVMEAKNPTTITYAYTNPNGLATTNTSPTLVAVGEYYIEPTMDVAGRWEGRATGTGAVVAGTPIFEIEVS